jgi:hypothetical protein
LEGHNVDQVVLGSETIATGSYIPVQASSSGDQVTLEGGRLHGLTPRSQFDIYGPETHSFQPPERPLARATLEEVDATTSTARISPAVGIPPGAKAVERQHNFEAQKTRVLYERLDRSAALRQLQQALDRTPTHAFASVAAGERFQIRVVEEGGRLRTFGADGMELGTGVAVHDPELVDRLEDRALHWARWLGLLALRNPAAADSVEFRLVPRGRPAEPGRIPVFAPGRQPFDIKVKNRSRQQLFVYILDLPSDGSVRQVYPDPGQTAPLGPGEETSIGDWTINVPNGAASVRDVFKLVAATRQIDLSYLRMDTPRGNEPPAERPRDPLSRLLYEAAMGARNADRQLAVDWSTSEVVFEVCRELDRDGRCRRALAPPQNDHAAPPTRAAKP